MSVEQTNIDEITLKELFLKLGVYKKELIKHWIWILVVAIPIGAYLYYKTSTKPPMYKSELSFMMDDDAKGSAPGGMSSILGQFGMSGGSGSSSNPLTMISLIKTRNISENVLFEKIEIDKREDYLANFIISDYEENNSWFSMPWYKRLYKEPSKLIGFRFKHSEVDSFSRTESYVLKRLVSMITGNSGSLSTSYDELTGITRMVYFGFSENVTLNVVKKYFSSLSDYYYNKTIEKQEKNYILLKAKTDSLSFLLSSKEFQLANFKDTNLNVISMADQLSSTKLHREIMAVGSMYAAALKNLEMAEYAFNLKKPLIQVIDNPIYPLRKITESKTKAGITGFLIGVFLMSLFFILRKTYRDVMAG